MAAKLLPFYFSWARMDLLSLLRKLEVIE